MQKAEQTLADKIMVMQHLNNKKLQKLQQKDAKEYEKLSSKCFDPTLFKNRNQRSNIKAVIE